MMLIRTIILTCLFVVNIQATSHWMVTEKGLIQPKDDSPFLMEKPYDLIEFLNQDTRWQNIYNIYYDLIRRQKKINDIWYEMMNVADFEKHVAFNENCNKAENVDSIDWYTSFMEDGRFYGIREEEFLLSTYESGDTDVPDCKKISSLTFSMATFEHLDGMRNRENLNATAEIALPDMFSPLLNKKQFGHWVSDMLRKNSSSWLHYNLAAIYWRVEGVVPKALECSRRAVHYAPRQYKAIALLCMGTIFHRSKSVEDALVVLGAAVDHSPKFPIGQFSLGSAYAVGGYYNNSLKHIELGIKLHRSFYIAKRFKYGILCHLDLFKKMDEVRSKMKLMSKEIQEFINKEVLWLKIQTAFLKSMKKNWKFEPQNIDGNIKKMSEITGLNIIELKKHADRNYMMQFFLDSPTYNEKWAEDKSFGALDTGYSFYKVLKLVANNYNFPTKLTKVDEKHLANVSAVKDEIGPMPPFPNEMFMPKRVVPVMSTTYKKEIKHDLDEDDMESGVLKSESNPGELYPPNMKVNRQRELFDTDPEWPSHSFCKDNADGFPDNVEFIYPVFMRVENKGYRISSILSSGVGVPALTEMALPWHPPLCDAARASTHTKKGLKVQLAPESVSREYLRDQLLLYIADHHIELLRKMQDAEIGQRITSAIEQKLAPAWVLYTLASVYWRVRRAPGGALQCLWAALRAVPPVHRDAVLVSLASVHLELGHIDDASQYIEEAYKINPYEPSTNFILAQISMIKKNHKAQMFHMKQVIRVSPNYMNGFVRNLLNAWACILKQVDTLKELGEVHEPEICAEVDSDMSMVCERDGTNCHVSSGNCQVATRKHAVSTLVRLLELNDDDDDVDATIFDKFIKAMPPKRTDIVSHQRNYDLLTDAVYMLIKGCGQKGCGGLPTYLSFTEDDCAHQHMQLDFWLTSVSFKEELVFDKNIVSEILETTASGARVPECVVPSEGDADFFVRRSLRADASEWGPVLSAMHTFADIFNYYDYSALGAKIAAYVETRPGWWVGLAGAAWWCGAGGRGQCARACAAAALARAPHHLAHRALRPLAVLLHLQAKHQDAKEIAYLAFYASPKTAIEAYLVAVSHTYTSEYEQAAWMYRYALTFDPNYFPVKASLHITMCLMTFGEAAKKNLNAVAA